MTFTKKLVFLPPSLCPQVSTSDQPPSPLWTPTFRIMHCSMVWHVIAGALKVSGSEVPHHNKSTEYTLPYLPKVIHELPFFLEFKGVNNFRSLLAQTPQMQLIVSTDGNERTLSNTNIQTQTYKHKHTNINI